MAGGEPLKGLAARVFDVRHPEEIHLRYRFRKGVKHGRVDGWDRERNRVYEAKYEDGMLVPGSEKWNGEGTVEDFLEADRPSSYYQVHYSAGAADHEVVAASSAGDDLAGLRRDLLSLRRTEGELPRGPDLHPADLRDRGVDRPADGLLRRDLRPVRAADHRDPVEHPVPVPGDHRQRGGAGDTGRTGSGST